MPPAGKSYFAQSKSASFTNINFWAKMEAVLACHIPPTRSKMGDNR